MGRAVERSEKASLSCNWKNEVKSIVGRTRRRTGRRTRAKTVG